METISRKNCRIRVIEAGLNEEIIAKKQHEAEAIAQSQMTDRIDIEKRERAIYETLKVKYGDPLNQ